MNVASTINLGQCKAQLASWASHTLEITTSIDVNLPEEHSNITTAVQIHEKSTQGNLWTAKAGSCRIICNIEDSYALEESLALHDGRKLTTIKELVAQAFETTGVWAGLGLSISRDPGIASQLEEASNQIVMVCEHRDAQSGLFTPPKVPVLHLKNVVFNLCFKPNAPQRARRQKQPPVKPDFSTVTAPPRRSTRHMTSTSFPYAVDHAAASTAVGPKPSDIRETSMSDRQGITCLVQAALLVVSGTRKRSPGCHYTLTQDYRTLLDVAPGVFSLRYFKNMTVHFNTIPKIPSTFPTLGKVASSSLRKKLAKPATTFINGTLPSQRNEVVSIEPQLSSLVMRLLKMPAIKALAMSASPHDNAEPQLFDENEEGVYDDLYDQLDHLETSHAANPYNDSRQPRDHSASFYSNTINTDEPYPFIEEDGSQRFKPAGGSTHFFADMRQDSGICMDINSNEMNDWQVKLAPPLMYPPPDTCDDAGNSDNTLFEHTDGAQAHDLPWYLHSQQLWCWKESESLVLYKSAGGFIYGSNRDRKLVELLQKDDGDGGYHAGREVMGDKLHGIEQMPPFWQPELEDTSEDHQALKTHNYSRYTQHSIPPWAHGSDQSLTIVDSDERHRQQHSEPVGHPPGQNTFSNADYDIMNGVQPSSPPY